MGAESWELRKLLATYTARHLEGNGNRHIAQAKNEAEVRGKMYATPQPRLRPTRARRVPTSAAPVTGRLCKRATERRPTPHPA